MYACLKSQCLADQWTNISRVTSWIVTHYKTIIFEFYLGEPYRPTNLLMKNTVTLIDEAKQYCNFSSVCYNNNVCLYYLHNITCNLCQLLNVTVPYFLLYNIISSKATLQSKHNNCIMTLSPSVWWHHGVLQIITVTFLLFLAPAGGSNPAGPIFKPYGAIINLNLAYKKL